MKGYAFVSTPLKPQRMLDETRGDPGAERWEKLPGPVIEQHISPEATRASAASNTE
jgi:hypothetical protein